MCSVVPLTMVAGPEVTASVTARPDEAVACSATSKPKGWSVSGPKAIVWSFFGFTPLVPALMQFWIGCGRLVKK